MDTTIPATAKVGKFTRCCDECGSTFVTNRREATFCSDEHRKAWHNRRMKRGAELYDLVMSMRFDRKHAADEGLWSQVCAMASAYNTADKTLRGGRRSWDKHGHKRLPLAYGDQGDNR